MSEEKEITIEDVIARQRQNNPNANIELVRKAYDYAKVNPVSYTHLTLPTNCT